MAAVRFLRPTGAWIFLVAWLVLTAWAQHRPVEEITLDTRGPQTASTSGAATDP